MHIILTRPLEDCFEMMTKFIALGNVVTHMPLLSIKKIDHKIINFSNYKAIIFTSSNAIKFLDTKLISKNIWCFCVGKATEKKARQVGFLNVISSDGNVEALKELIFRNFEKTDGKLIYFSSEIITTDLDKALNKKGYDIDHIINYTAAPIDHISDDIIKIFKSKPPDIMYVYSEKSAINLRNLLKKYSLVDSLNNCNLMCISEKISRVLINLKWKKIFIFNSGEEEFLLNKI